MKIYIFKVGSGFGYKVGGVTQEHHPDQSGFILMTRAEAIEEATKVAYRLLEGFPDEAIEGVEDEIELPSPPPAIVQPERTSNSFFDFIRSLFN